MYRPYLLIGALLVALPILTSAALPSKGPVPPADPRPAEATRPAQEAPTAESPASESTAPDSPVPVPETKPSVGEPAARVERPAPAPLSGSAKASSTPASTVSPRDHPAKDVDLGGTRAIGDAFRSAIETEDPDAYAACITALRAIGATFSEMPRIEDSKSCGIDRPVEVEALLPDVRLVPKAQLRCETTLQMARMTRDLLIPAATTAFPDRPALTEIHQASSYVCRNRNSADEGKISEHAYGNAIDIAGLRFGDETMPVMIAKQDDGTAEAAFQRAFNAIACLYFTTVLSPGSDATHQDHMHLDVIRRKGGFRYCR